MIYGAILKELSKIPGTHIYNNVLYDDFGFRLFWKQGDAVFVRPSVKNMKGHRLQFKVDLKDPNALDFIKDEIKTFIKGCHDSS